MLNYIWIGLIIIGIFVAVGNDISDEVRQTYRNGAVLEGTLEITKRPTQLRATWEGDLVIPAASFNTFYGVTRTESDVRQHIT
ncbi:hypothetical protein NL529_28995, partial [Klebsiella pneumoniae]|nr:hypothetical protein [Klebsiella pneumoniae]